MSEKGQVRGLWGEIALALALITLATILLNAGVFWLLLKTSDANRRIELTETLAQNLATQLEVEAGQEERSRGYRRVLKVYEDRGQGFEELYLVDPEMNLLVSVKGNPPETADEGLREALFGKNTHSEFEGPLWGDRSIIATAPVAPQGNVVAAVRIKVPLANPLLPGGMAGFVLAYTLSSGLAIAVFGFSLFRRRLIRPILEIQEGTRVIAGGEFTHRVEVDASRELQHLCVSLNQLGASLAAYKSRTQDHVEEVEAANRELRQAQEALIRSERLASVGRLAAGLAHEVGNPLAAVLGYMELLGQDLRDRALEKDLLARSEQELNRIHHVLRGLLDHAHPGTGEIVEIDPMEAVVEAVSRMEPQAAFQGVVIEIDPRSSVPVAMAPEKLQQVLVNLMLNAVGAMEESEDSKIRWEIEAVDGGVELRCLDSGPGFLEPALEHSFEPFFTTKDVGEGTGLGLYTCLQLVRAVGGRMAVSNRSEGGARVSLWLPAFGGTLESR